MTTDWIKDLKPGDAIIVHYGLLGDKECVSRVERTTKTQVITNHSRYSRDTGRQIGGGWWITQATDTELPRVQNEELRQLTARKIMSVDLKSLPLDTLKRALEVLTA